MNDRGVFLSRVLFSSFFRRFPLDFWGQARKRNDKHGLFWNKVCNHNKKLLEEINNSGKRLRREKKRREKMKGDQSTDVSKGKRANNKGVCVEV